MSWNVCNGRCKHFKGLRKTCKNSYMMGYTRCNTCKIFFFTELYWCECCSGRLRKPKGDIKRI